MKKIAAVILAAGQGTRMKSSMAKVLHPLAGAPMLSYVLDAVCALEPEKILVVTGYQEKQVRAAVADYPVKFVNQARQLGTGHAVLQTYPELKGFAGDILVLNGDTPLLTPDTLKKLVEEHVAGNYIASLLSAVLPDAGGYGRVLRDERNKVVKIVEEKDASEKQRTIKEIASGMYCFASPVIFTHLEKLSPENAQGEYYLTDIIDIYCSQGRPVGARVAGNYKEIMGINDRAQQARAEAVIRERINQKWLRGGVRMINPSATYLDKNVTLGNDTVLYPQTVIEGKTTIGRNCVIGPNNHIKNSEIGDNVNILANCIITESIINSGANIGPVAHLRPGTVLEEGAKVGNFVEIKKSRIGKGSKVNHLSYVGDCQVGEGVNIGAGTITCNYDGARKHTTVIEDGVFIGSGTQLVAPVRLGKQSWIGAGSTITKDVPPHALALSRTRQELKNQWVKRKGKA